MNEREKVLSVARAQINYVEKESNKNLDSKTANAGDENYTKYARDFDTKYTTFYNGKKQGAAWCDIWVDWCFVEALGEKRALEILCQPKKSCGAGCGWSADYYKAKGRFGKEPRVGAQIFFQDSDGDPCHTGLVTKVGTKHVYTIEGNTSSAPGVVANGGAVAEKKYYLDSDYIYGYGYPDYEDIEEITEEKPKENSKINEEVLEWQKAAIEDGFEFPLFGADGEWGPECERVASKAIVMMRSDGYYYPELTKIVQRAVGATVDGKCGPKTRSKIRLYQYRHDLYVDGKVGLNTWRKILLG